MFVSMPPRDSDPTRRSRRVPRRVLEKLDHLIRERQPERAKDLIERVRVGRDDVRGRVALAGTANRIGAFDKALSLLKPLAKLNPSTAADVRIEAARALVWLGLPSQALRLLRSVSSTGPQASRYLRVWSHAHFRQWDWITPQTALKTATQTTAASSSEGLALRMRLASSLLHGSSDFDGARALCREVLDHTSPEQHATWYVDAHNILVQCDLFSGQFEAARASLQRYRSVLTLNDERIGARLARLWEGLLDLQAGQASQSASARSAAVASLEALHAEFEAAGLADWARTEHFYRAVLSDDRALASRLYFGSNLPCLRKRLLAAMKLREQDLPEHLLWEVTDPEATQGVTVELEVRPPRFASTLEDRALLALVADFYSPVTLPVLFERIYPDEIYNPASSPNRVWQALHRLRAQLKRQKIQVEIRETGGRFKIFPREGRLVLKLPRPHFTWTHPHFSPQQQLGIDLVLKASAGKPFKTSDVMKLLDVSRPTAVALLKACIEEHILERTGRGPRAQYRFP